MKNRFTSYALILGLFTLTNVQCDPSSVDGPDEPDFVDPAYKYIAVR